MAMPRKDAPLHTPIKHELKVWTRNAGPRTWTRRSRTSCDLNSQKKSTIEVPGITHLVEHQSGRPQRWVSVVSHCISSLTCGNSAWAGKMVYIRLHLPYAIIKCWAYGKHQGTTQGVGGCSPGWGPQPEWGKIKSEAKVKVSWLSNVQSSLETA